MPEDVNSYQQPVNSFSAEAQRINNGASAFPEKEHSPTTAEG
jgi:hypothetical protein